MRAMSRFTHTSTVRPGRSRECPTKGDLFAKSAVMSSEVPSPK